MKPPCSLGASPTTPEVLAELRQQWQADLNRLDEIRPAMEAWRRRLHQAQAAAKQAWAAAQQAVLASIAVENDPPMDPQELNKQRANLAMRLVSTEDPDAIVRIQGRLHRLERRVPFPEGQYQAFCIDGGADVLVALPDCLAVDAEDRERAARYLMARAP